MRVVSVFVMLLLSAGTAAAQQDPPPEAAGDLAEVMRSILFPNSNLIFDAQSADPGAPPAEAAGGDSTTARFSGIYTGWEQVENAAVALAEAANLITLPRLCENVEDDPARNGNPVPIERDDWKQHTARLREVGLAAVEWARRQQYDEDEVLFITGDIAEACANCHSVYRDSYTDPPTPRCTPPSED